MFKKYYLIIFSLFLLTVFCINLILRKSAPLSYAALLNYNQLYYDQKKIRIEDFSLAGDSLEIYFAGGSLDSGRNNIFQVFTGPRLLVQLETSGRKIRFKLDSTGMHQVSIAVNGSPEKLMMNIDFSPDSLYRNGHNSSNTVYELTTNVAARAGRLFTVQDWAIQYSGEETAGFAMETKKMLDDSIRLLDGDDCRHKISKIAKFILSRTAGKEGIPSDSISHMHPLKQLAFIEAGKSKAWCGNFSSIFSYLASSAGMPVRLVSCGLSEAGVATGVHVFCEVYLKEDQCWAYVDLTAKNILVRYNKQWLNVIDIQRLMRYPVQDSSFVALHFEKDSLYEVPFFKVSGLAANYFHSNAVFRFYFGDYLRIMEPSNIFSRGIKFFYGKPYYAIYSDNFPENNAEFTLRIFTNYLLAAGLLFWLIAVLKKIF